MPTKAIHSSVVWGFSAIVFASYGNSIQLCLLVTQIWAAGITAELSSSVPHRKLAIPGSAIVLRIDTRLTTYATVYSGLRSARLHVFGYVQFATYRQVFPEEQHMFAEGRACACLTVRAMARVRIKAETFGNRETDQPAQTASLEFVRHRAFKPFCSNRQRAISMRSWPKNGSPSNTSVGTPQWPAASSASWFASISASSASGSA